MKTQKSFTVLFFLFSFSITVLAQNPIATLQHKEQTKVFYGPGSFAEAFAASINSDTIYLSPGAFNPPATYINKGIAIVGSGYFPDEVTLKTRTVLLGDLRIGGGADSLLLEGIYFDKDLSCEAKSIRNIKIIRCRMNNFIVSGSSPDYAKDNCLVDECFIDGSIINPSCSNYFQVRHSAINGQINNITKNAIIEGNIFFTSGDCLTNLTGSLIRNNIFLSNRIISSNYNSIYNNIFTTSGIYSNTSTNYSDANYFNVNQADIFVNQSGNSISYTHDYHLKNPEKYIGTDGTQVGIYGGFTPFKEKGLPFNPQITSKTIAHETDNDGNLNISVTVAAQER
jgi:hypothetical protein